MLYNCLVVDDEPDARLLLEAYISKIIHLNLIDSCSNAFEAQKVINEKPIDIVFLDIKMPQFTGLELAQVVKHKKLAIVFTTAFTEFAVNGFDLGVVDYLLKPIAFDRFVTAVGRVIEKNTGNYLDKSIQNKEATFIFLKTGKHKHIKIDFSGINYIESYGNYSKIYTDKTILSIETLSNLEKILPQRLFCRIHKSYIVNMSKVTLFEPNYLCLGLKHLPIGKSYKQLFKSIFEVFKNT